ncbi:TadE/TadG family type IV pilus assembly protein [Pseudomonas sp. SP16.1]|uniref:TadE/TadG family type IV pilus assembly protein n=1 Tax=Pseudomonas sp. SP16.1 TaxID=3458854 RepID=UPI00404585A9
MKQPVFRQRRTQHGLAMVEFTIALPLLLLLLLAIGEFGRLLYHYNNLMQASRDAGRYVAGLAWNRTLGKIDLTGLETPTLETRTRNVAVYGVPIPGAYPPVVPGLTTGQVSVSEVDTEHVQVSINYEFRPVIGSALPSFFGRAIPLNIPLVATTVMRAL